MDLLGIYAGIVEKNDDPERLGRIKVRVPHVYGIIGSAVGAIPIDDLPWAIPMGLPAGGTTRSGGMDWLPEPGDQVSVQFLDGQPEKPVWSWMMQTQSQVENFPLHQYEAAGNRVGRPKRAALTRYGHTVEWNEGSIVMSTSNGYQVLLLDGDNLDGQILIRTQAGQFLTLDDDTSDGKLFVLDDFYLQLGSELNVLADNIVVETTTGSVDMTIADALQLLTLGLVDVTAGGTLTLTSSEGMTLESSAGMTLTAAQAMAINFGSLLTLGGGSEPFVRGIQLTTFLTSLLTWLSTHAHTSGSPGSPTSPPLIPPVGVVQPEVSQLVSETIFGK